MWFKFVSIVLRPIHGPVVFAASRYGRLIGTEIRVFGFVIARGDYK